mmetsp:Transcript_2564/g.5489  ORF Transcript_2564/g.5489 Transcript_2564/m.5489 type:complete len:342 (+) Transcript_2564:142-1167(+)|eukprot:CAMPEP_0172324802 /NCGR_PEP_ID=MMETSP1058-20130122/52393_1 /TAXON_ID=83371 /ORGANISM="Detonula confervacea, Strain CCMP 353" /LENGTH=341 /DNA_ID=CAMNT_0013041195 /DNA_START=64 /DNA_END=1089 /DNA_ORIENTATION=-
MDAVKALCSRVTDYFNCRMMPHGGPILFPIVLVTLGLCASLADDGCDYARLRGAAVEMLTGSSAVPFIDCGMSAYRIPGFYPAENAWRVVYSDECQPYQYMNLLSDTSWVAANWLRFLSLVVGGTTTMFLWTSTCLTLRPKYWQAAGIGAALACLSQMCSFVWFYTKLCHTSTTNFGDFEAGREVEVNSEANATSSCTLFFGSNCAITSCVLWGVASAVILLREYPMPVPKLIARDEHVAMVPAPGQTQSSGHRVTSRSNRKLDVEKSSRSLDLTASISTAQTSQRSLQWISGTPTGGHDNIRASLRTSMRPAEANKGSNRPSNIRPNDLAGSTFSAVSFA